MRIAHNYENGTFLYSGTSDCQVERATQCPRLYPLRIISRKWSYLILRLLREPQSFAEIQRELKYITNHILSRELRLLQEEKLITADKKYTLTPSGRALYEAVDPLVAWSLTHTTAVACPSQKRCSTCLNYTNTIGVKNYMQIGKK